MARGQKLPVLVRFAPSISSSGKNVAQFLLAIAQDWYERLAKFKWGVNKVAKAPKAPHAQKRKALQVLENKIEGGSEGFWGEKTTKTEWVGSPNVIPGQVIANAMGVPVIERPGICHIHFKLLP